MNEIGATAAETPSEAVYQVVDRYRMADELAAIATDWAPYGGEAIVEPFDALTAHKRDWCAADGEILVWDHDGRYDDTAVLDRL